MSLLTPEDHAFFRENGYLHVRNVIPKADCDAVVDAIWNFLGMNPNDPEDWYRLPLKPGGMIEMYQHPAMWNNRQNPKLYQAFSELLGQEKLWVSIDRVNMKPPSHPDHPEYDHKGFIHWDTDTSKLPTRRGVQGVVYLADTAPNQGGFQCVPALFRDEMRDLAGWIAAQPADRNPHVPDMTHYEVVPIPGEAGDLIIWDSWLAHGNGHNLSDKPRLAQFISMRPAPTEPNAETEEHRQHRIRCWQNRMPPGNSVFPGDPREIEQKFGTTAELTPLGRKLLGLDPWE